MGSTDPIVSKKVENLLDLQDIGENSILHVIQDRFDNKRIYTNVGNLLVALNPFERFSIYDDAVISQYQHYNKTAHIFSIPRNALDNIQRGSPAENIVFSGESGSGKTFNSLQVMNYLATSADSKITSGQVRAVSTVIRSFASAKTSKNDVATRFGYSVDFLYKKTILSGLSLRTTLPLETIRVTSQRAGERNFNIFYEVCAGLSAEDKHSYGIKEQQKFFYLNQGKARETIDEDAKNFIELDEALVTLGFSYEQRHLIYKSIAAILHIGNIYFRQKRTADNESNAVEVGNEGELKWSTFLLAVDLNRWAPAFVHKFSKCDNGITTSSLTMSQALDNRDSLAMLLYEEIFKWVISKIGQHFKCPDSTGCISVVDYYGFERYNNNGLEQMLINSVNEKMESIFVKQTFHEEIATYIREGLSFQWKVPNNLDNSKVIELLNKKPYGLLHLLDDECKFPKASDESYLQHCNLNHLDKCVYGKARNKDRLEFSIRHSVGNTWYTVHDFIHKNKRSVSGFVLKTLAESDNPVISMLFRPLVNGKEHNDYIIYAAHAFTSTISTMTEKILNGYSHFIRCVRTNNEHMSGRFDLPTVSRQLKSLAIIDVLQFRFAGYTVKIPFQEFTRSFRCLLPSDIALCQNQKEIIVDILDGQGVKYSSDYQIGSNYVFLRERFADKLHSSRKKTRRDAAYIIQKTMRAYFCRRRYLEKKKAVIKIQAGFRGWKTRKETAILREQLFKTLGIQTRRNKRLKAYNDSLFSEETSESSSPALIGSIEVGDDVIRTLQKSIRKPGKSPELQITTSYLGIPFKKTANTIEPITLENFAQDYFKGHLLEQRREPILTPFLHKDNDLDFRKSIDIFKLILKYMNDKSLAKHQLDDLGRCIVQQGILNPCQRDEILVQICNQTYRNQDKQAADRGWRLAILAVGAFPVSEITLSMFISYFGEQPPLLQNYLMTTLMRRTTIKDHQIARLLPASSLEMAANIGYHTAVVAVSTQDEALLHVEAHVWASNEDIVNRTLRHKGIGNPSGWSLEVETEDKIYCPAGSHFFHDVIADIENLNEENKRSYFYNYPPVRTIAPVNRKKVETNQPSTTKIIYPVEKRARGINETEVTHDTSRRGHRDKSSEAINGLIPNSNNLRDHFSGNKLDVADRSFNSDANNMESEYCYTLPNKKKTTAHVNRPPHSNHSFTRFDRNEPHHIIQGNKPLETHTEDSMTFSQRPPSQNKENRYRGSQEQFCPERTDFYVPHTYCSQPTVPVVQYVPMIIHPSQSVVAPQLVPSQSIINQPIISSSQMVSTQPIMLSGQSVMPMQYNINYGENETSFSMATPLDCKIQAKTHTSTDDDNQRKFDSIRSNSLKDFESIRSLGTIGAQKDCRSRHLSSRCDYVPSEYSIMSVASRIKRIPVPNNSRDVDKFLDEVFDQVLSPHEFKEADVNSNQIAASIKGGPHGSTDYDTLYERCPINEENYSQVYNQPDYPNGSNPYDYIDRENMNMAAGTSMRTLPRQDSRSHPHTVSRATKTVNQIREEPTNELNMSQRSNGYSHIEDNSIDMSNISSQLIHQQTIIPPSTPVPPAPSLTGQMISHGKQAMFIMMPVQMNGGSNQMMQIPVMMAPQMVAHNGVTQNMMYYMPPEQETITRSPEPSRKVRQSMDVLSKPPHTLNRVEDPRLSVHSRMERTLVKSPESATVSVHNSSPVPHNSMDNASWLQNRHSSQAKNELEVGQLPRARPRSSSPIKSSKQVGLNRIPQEIYTEPVVQNTVSNSEHLNPNKFRVPEINLVKEIQHKEYEALQKINERMKHLPPPVDNVRVFIPKKPIKPSKEIIVVPDEPKSIVHPNNFLPEKVEQPRSEWVYEGEVERPMELQERVRNPTTRASVVPDSQASVTPNSQKPAVKYVKQPWKLTIRKEIFLPGEPLDDVQVIDQVFAQIISDCRKGIAYRIKAYERDDVVAILKEHKVPPDLLNKQSEIPTDIKVAVIEAARKWPVYFTQIFEVVEERMSESVSVLLSIGEHGIRLLLHTPLDKENPLKVQDHFSYADIAEVIQKDDDLICLQTHNGMSIWLRTRMASQIKKQIDKCICGQVMFKQFVRAKADFITKQSNLLSFKQGDIIELVPSPDGENAPTGSWLYGKIGNQFGSLPAQYVTPMDHSLNENETVAPLPLSSDFHEVGDLISGKHEHENGYKYTMMEFALNNFRGPKGFDNHTNKKKNKKEWTWQDVAHKVKFTDKPITHSLLRLESNEMDKLACEAFLCIMRFMGDEPIRRGETMTDTIYRLLLICHKNAVLRDEVYCQIIRQTTHNKSTKVDSTVRGWRLFLILTAYFECSLALRPYLLNYLTENADDPRRIYHGTAQLCLQNLAQTMRYGGRKYLLSGMEVEEITNGKILKRQVYMLPGGHKKIINTKSITVVEEIIMELCKEINIRSPSEQQEFCLCYVLEKENSVQCCSNDEYILDICTELEHKKLKFYFLLKRMVWVLPLRLDNPVYIDAMFFQIVIDYLQGSFVCLQGGNQLSATMTDDICRLAAFLHLASNEERKQFVSGRSIMSLIPTVVLDARIMPVDSWTERINHKLMTIDNNITSTQARATFLEVLSSWPLFGATNFALEAAIEQGQPLPPIELSIGKSGIRLLSPISHRIINEWNFDKIISTKTDGVRNSTVIMTVGTTKSSRTFEFRTSDASEIVRLVGQYTYVVRESKGLLEQ